MVSDETVGDNTNENKKPKPKLRNWYFSLTAQGGLYMIIKSAMPEDAMRARDKLYGVNTFQFMWSEAEWNREVLRNYTVKLFKELTIE